MENYKIDWHSSNDHIFTCAVRYSNNIDTVKYLTSIELTQNMIKILYKYNIEYANQIIKSCNIKMFDNNQSFKWLFVLNNTLYINNAVYFGIV